MEPFPYWRNIYNTVVDEFKAVSADYVSEVLLQVNDDLLEGILIYSKYDSVSYTTWKAKVQVANAGNIEMLMKDTSYALNLDCTITYRMFCNYIMFEYYGKITDIEEASSVELYRKLFINKMWQFVSAERMFQLKTMQFLMQHYGNSSHLLSKIIKEFVDRHGWKSIRQKLLAQFKLLMNDVCPHGDHGLSSHNCVQRDQSELIQTFITYIYTMEHSQVDADELCDLLHLFNNHGFAINILYSGVNSEPRNLEYLMVLMGLQNIWAGTDWSADFAKLEKHFGEICSMANCHSLLTLCWSMMVLSLPSAKIPPNYLANLPILIIQSINEESMSQLYKLLDNNYKFESKLNMLTATAVYNFFKLLCNRIDNVMKIYETPYSVAVVAKLLDIPHICGEIMLEANPVNRFVSVNLFPYDTRSFAIMHTALIKNEQFTERVIEQMKNISVYTEVPDNSNVVIPPHTQTFVLQLSSNKTLVQYRGPNIAYSFLASFEVAFQNILDYATNPHDDSPTKNEDVDNVIVCMDLVIELMTRSVDVWQDEHFQNILTYCKLVLARTSLDGSTPLLINKILRLFTRGMRIRYKMLSSILLSTSCLPTATSHMISAHQLVKINLWNDCKLLQLIMRERSLGNYELIYTYLDFIKDCLNHQYENERFLLPGMIFLIQHIFPVHLGWKEPSVHEKNRLSYDILTMLFTVLHSHMKKSDGDHSSEVLYEICSITLLNNDAFVKTFLTILRYRNEYIEQLMVREVDWDIGRTRDVILSVRQAVTIVLWLFNNIPYDELRKTVFWQYFSYSGVNFPSVLRIICEYINHKFDTVLPKLACRLFRRVSLDASIPVLACMEIDNYQVQSMFLERLRDPLEDDEMRIALLELITTCVKTQNGMTAAFFNMHVKKPSGGTMLPEKSDETIINFLGEYLEGIAASPATLKSPVQSAILTLFHTLWKQKRLSLIQTLIRENSFWRALISPLDKNYHFQSETYFQILDILAMECFYTSPDDLTKEITELFSSNVGILKKIFTLTMHSLRNTDVNCEGAMRIQNAWKRFIVLMVCKHQECMNNEAKLFLMTSTLEGLLDHLQSPKNTNIIADWMDLYMYLCANCKCKDFATEKNFDTLAICYKTLDEVYLRLHKKGRETVITIILKTIDQFHDFFAKDDCAAVNEFLLIVRKIIEKEYDDSVYKQCKMLNVSDHVAWHLILILGNHMLQFENHHKWLFFTQYLQKIANTLGFYASSTLTMPIAKMSAMFLYNLSRTALVEEFLTLDFAEVYQSFRSPKELANYSSLQNNGRNPDYYMDYWLTYSYLINLKAQLLQKLGFAMFRKILDFVHMQRDELFQFFKLCQVTVNPMALKLIASCIRLFNLLLKWDSIMDFPTITAYYEILPEVLNSCINILLRPKMIKFYVPYEVVNLELLENIPLSYITSIMDRIIDVIAMSCRGMLQVTPPLEKLIHSASAWQRTSHQLQLSWDFHIPNVYNPQENISSLTFGALMCVVHYLSKARQLQAVNRTQSKKDTMIYIPTMLPEADLETRPEGEIQTYVSFICPDYIEPATIEPFNSIHRFATSEIYSLTSPWLSHLDQERTNFALELINTLLASQIYKTVMFPVDDWNVKQQMHMLKRELCSELHFFHDFVRKHSVHSDTYEFDGNRIVCLRKTTNKNYSNLDYLMMLSHWFMEICHLSP